MYGPCAPRLDFTTLSTSYLFFCAGMMADPQQSGHCPEEEHPNINLRVKLLTGEEHSIVVAPDVREHFTRLSCFITIQGNLNILYIASWAVTRRWRHTFAGTYF